MAIFNNMSLTNQGQALYAKAQAGIKLNFTKMMVGSGTIGTANPATLISLITPQFDVPLQAITSNTEAKTATISGTLVNTNVTVATYICEIGLFATDPDVGEILYAYGSTGSYGDYMAPATSGAYSWNYQINAAIGNASNVTVTLSNLQYDYGVINSNTTFVYLNGGNQKEINKSIDNKFKVYPTTNSGNVYSVTVSDLTTLTDGYPITVKFNEASTGAISIKVNSSPTAIAIVDYFGNSVTNVRKNLIANLRYEATSANFQLQGKGGGGNATASQLLLGAKATVDSGPILGALDLSNLVSGNLRSGVTISNGLTSITGKSSVVDTSDALATAVQILSGASAYVNGVKIPGTMTNYVGDQNCSSYATSGTTIGLKVPQGYWDGTHYVNVSDSNFISSNIPIGKSILGLAGSYDPLTLIPGDSVVLYQRDGNLGTSSSTYTLIESHVVQGRGGAVRIKFSVSCAGSSSGVVGYTRIYVNGSPRGIEHTMCSASVVTFTEDISINAGDTIQLYVHPATAGYNETISEFIICCGNNYGYVS